MRSLSWLVVCAAFLLTHWNFVSASTEDYKPMRSEVDPDACNKWDYHVATKGPWHAFWENTCGPKRKEYCEKMYKKYTNQQLEWLFKRYCVGLPRYGWDFNVFLYESYLDLTPEEEALVGPVPAGDDHSDDLFEKQEGPPEDLQSS